MSQTAFKIEGTEDGAVNDVMICHNTITDAVCISVNGTEVFLEKEEFQRLAQLMVYDFYTRTMIEAAERQSHEGICPYRILKARDMDSEKWEEV